MPSRIETATGDPRLHAVIITADPADRHSATAITRLSVRADELLVSTLFDLPFEEPEPEPEPATPPPRPPDVPARRVVTVSELTRRTARTARDDVS